MLIQRCLLFAVAMLLAPAADADDARQFCLDGEFDIGARLQGTWPQAGEWVPTRWCVTTDADSKRVRFYGKGKSNPDLEGEYSALYLPPDRILLLRHGAAPDLEFYPADIAAEAERYRRLDPARLLDAVLAEHDLQEPADGWFALAAVGSGAAGMARIESGRLAAFRTSADLPLRGRVPVLWRWQWPSPEAPEAELIVDNELLFRATGSYRALATGEDPFTGDSSAAPQQIPGAAWPARVAMRLETLGEHVYRVNNVRTGFSHLVVDTAGGLVIADAPAGWVELPQVPPADLVPGLGVSGLSEALLDFLADELPGRPLRAVALTHAHDDHAGGARAMAAAGAEVYAPAALVGFLAGALNRAEHPADRLAEQNGTVTITPVTERVELADSRHPVRLLSLGSGPHSAAGLGVHVPAAGYFFVSDVHVPQNDSPVPRSDFATTECWFARWAVDNLPPDTIVLNSHSTGKTPLSRLGQYLQSEACRAIANPD